MCTWQCGKQALLYSVFLPQNQNYKPTANSKQTIILMAALPHTTPWPPMLRNQPNILKSTGAYHCTHHCRHCGGTATIPLPPFTTAGTIKPGRVMQYQLHHSPQIPPLSASLPTTPHWQILQPRHIGVFTINIGGHQSAEGAIEAIAGIVCPRRNCIITNTFHPCRHHSYHSLLLPTTPIGRYCSRNASRVFTINIGGHQSTGGAANAIVAAFAHAAIASSPTYPTPAGSTPYHCPSTVAPDTEYINQPDVGGILVML